jgi:tRNA1(Val) A37 N6-methylase TrmN6
VKPEPAATSGEEHSVDAFLGGLVTLVQPRKGHRAGLDAALLQALVPASAAGRAVDLGAGVGTVAFCVAARAAELSVTGIERDAGLVARGREALALPQNAAFADRVHLIAADVSDKPALSSVAEPGSVDWVLMNPPYDVPGRGTQSPDPRRRDAHVASEGLLEAWAAAAISLLKPGGFLGLIHRAYALNEVKSALARSFGGLRVRPVHPTEERPALRILVTAERGSNAPLDVLPGLVLHQKGGGWTPQADAILRGTEELAE